MAAAVVISALAPRRNTPNLSLDLVKQKLFETLGPGGANLLTLSDLSSDGLIGWQDIPVDLFRNGQPIADPQQADRIFGGEGNDRLEGGDGHDWLYGEDGTDTLLGQSGDDKLFGGNDADTLDGGLGNDELYGEGGGDILDGGDGADLLQGDNGDDYFEAGGGDDRILGSLGSDLLVQIVDADQTLTDTTLDGQGFDVYADIERVHLYGGPSDNVFDVSGTTLGVAFLFGAGGLDRVISTGDVDYLLSDWTLRKSLGGVLGLDSIEDAVLTCGSGDNTFTLTGWTGTATLLGQAGRDRLVMDHLSSATLTDTSLTRSSGSRIRSCLATGLGLRRRVRTRRRGCSPAGRACLAIRGIRV